MKLIFLITILITNINCLMGQDFSKEEIIELPIEMVNRISPFNPHYGHLNLKDALYAGPWKGLQVNLRGIPEDWENPVIKPIYFDFLQVVYQNYAQGNLADSIYYGFNRMLDASYGIQLEDLSLSKTPIKSVSHMVITELPDGSFKYKVDTNNDLDFSDEAVFEPFPEVHAFDEVDSLSKLCHWLDAELFVDDEVKEVQFPYYVKLGDDGMLWENFPHYGQTTYKEKIILVSSEFEATFRYESNIYLLDPKKKENTLNEIALNEYFDVDSILYQNLGADFGKKILRLKKINLEESNLEGTQVGFPAISFNGYEFTSKEEIDLSDYEGQFLFIEFWGTWCRPCIQDLPIIKEAFKQVNPDQIAFLGIAKDNPESLRKFLDINEIPWKQILSTPENNIVQQYNIQSFPSSILIDDKGFVVAKDVPAENLLNTLQAFINEHNRR